MPLSSGQGGGNQPGFKRVYCEFRSGPNASGRLGTAATGTAGDRNMLVFGGHGNVPAAVFEHHVLGTQTILAPVIAAGGLDIGSQDLANNDGMEINCGITSGSPVAFTVGSEACYLEILDLAITDVSGTDDLAFGFRKAEANQANVDDYDEAAFLNVISGALKSETILNNGATTTTDLGVSWADAATKSLRIEVSKSGVVTYYYSTDSAFDSLGNKNKVAWTQLTAAPSFTFDSGEVIVPFIYALNDTDVMNATTVRAFDCGKM